MAETEKQKNSPQETNITGRFDRYRSSYWAALVAALGMRYIAPPFVRKHWETRPGEREPTYFAKHQYAAITGAMITGVTAYYAVSTWKDMKNIFAQSLAWELDKDPKDIGFRDFLKSKNTIIHQTVRNYTKYNLRRFAVNSAFFSPFIFKPLFKKFDFHGESGVHFGVGANAAYLSSDVLTRQITPFEDLQSLIDRKVNHVEHFGDLITANDLLDVYERNAVQGVNSSFLGKRGTPAWDKAMQLFSRMADLVNQTYKNTTSQEEANFNFPKFIYLVGNGLINADNLDRSVAFVEIANRYGIREVKEVAAAFKQGASLEEVVKKYNINMSPAVTQQDLSRDDAPSISMAAREEKRRAEKPAEGLRLS